MKKEFSEKEIAELKSKLDIDWCPPALTEEWKPFDNNANPIFPEIISKIEVSNLGRLKLDDNIQPMETYGKTEKYKQYYKKSAEYISIGKGDVWSGLNVWQIVASVWLEPYKARMDGCDIHHIHDNYKFPPELLNRMDNLRWLPHDIHFNMVHKK